jgi:hypothetical protein
MAPASRPAQSAESVCAATIGDQAALRVELPAALRHARTSALGRAVLTVCALATIQAVIAPVRVFAALAAQIVTAERFADLVLDAGPGFTAFAPGAIATCYDLSAPIIQEPTLKPARCAGSG